MKIRKREIIKRGSKKKKGRGTEPRIIPLARRVNGSTHLVMSEILFSIVVPVPNEPIILHFLFGFKITFWRKIKARFLFYKQSSSGVLGAKTNNVPASNKYKHQKRRERGPPSSWLEIDWNQLATAALLFFFFFGERDMKMTRKGVKQKPAGPLKEKSSNAVDGGRPIQPNAATTFSRRASGRASGRAAKKGCSVYFQSEPTTTTATVTKCIGGPPVRDGQLCGQPQARRRKRGWSCWNPPHFGRHDNDDDDDELCEPNSNRELR